MSQRAMLGDGQSYKGQQIVRLTLEGTPSLLSTVITTGVIANAYQMDPTSKVTGFSSRFGSTFDEYRVLGVDVRVTPVSASTGVSKVWFDEKANNTPSANEAQERTSMPLANTNASSKSARIIRWRARDLLDLEYTQIGTSVGPVTFKTYTDAATWGAPAAVTPLWLVEPVFHIEFRGIKST